VTITKEGKRYSYPWYLLDEVGKSFDITPDIAEGFKHARQLVYAKNCTMRRNQSTVRYKCKKVDGVMQVTRVA